MNKNEVMKNLQKEKHFQEKLNKEISERTDLLNQSKTKCDMYNKWLKKLDKFEKDQIKRKEELEKRMQDALEKVKEYHPAAEVQKAEWDEDMAQIQSLFDLEDK